MKTWKDCAMQVCEERDIECRDEDDLREVFLDYCDPIELIQKLQKEIEGLKDAYKNVIKVNNEYVVRNSNLRKENDELTQKNKKLREVLGFYTHQKNREEHPKEAVVIMNDHRYDIACGACNEESKGQLARKTLREIDEEN